MGSGELHRVAEHVWGWGGDTSGKTDCRQIVMSLGCHQFSGKTSASHVLAKATTIFTHTVWWGRGGGVPVTYAWNQFSSKDTVQ